MAEQEKTDWRSLEAGFLYQKQKGDGSKFLSGYYKPEGKDGPSIPIVIFKNTNKDPKDPSHDKWPDYRLYHQPENKNQTQAAAKPAPKAAAKPTPKPAPKPAPAPVQDDPPADDVDF